MATEILRPNAAGDETAIELQYPNSTSHWDKVDEAVADDLATYVANDATPAYERDLYNLPSHSVGAGTINSITLYLRVWRYGTSDNVKASLKTGGSVYDSAALNPTPAYTWVTVSWLQTVNPKTSAAWTWDDIDALQIGASLYNDSQLSQVYVEVDYTAPAGWTGTFNGIKSPATAIGIASASLASVNGVTG